MAEGGLKKTKKIRKKIAKKINKPKKTSKKVNLTVKIEKPKIKIVRNKKIAKNTKNGMITRAGSRLPRYVKKKVLIIAKERTPKITLFVLV